jgi:hypothetical protein
MAHGMGDLGVHGQGLPLGQDILRVAADHHAIAVAAEVDARQNQWGEEGG